MKIVVLYDGAADDWSDEDVRQVVDSASQIAVILRAAGHQAQCVPVRAGLKWLSAVRRADAVFNLCESIAAVSRYEAFVAGTLELTGIPYTGARPEVISLCHRKPVCNALLSTRGLPVPRWVVPNGHRVPGDFPLPAIVKPAAEDASVGIDQDSVVTSRRGLALRVARLSEEHDEVLVQQYIPGRELAVGFVGSRALPLSEIDFSAMPDGAWPILSFSAKWEVGGLEDLGSRPVCPAPVSKAVAERLTTVAREAWTAVGGSGYGRVDMRLDEAGQPWILEVNPNPDIADDAGLSRMAKAAGWSYEDLILRIVDAALSHARETQSVDLLARGARSRTDRRSTGQQPRLA